MLVSGVCLKGKVLLKSIQIPERWCAKANMWVLPFSSKDNTMLWCFPRLKVTEVENTLPKIPFWLCSGAPLHLQDGRWHHWHRRALLSLCKFHCLWVWSRVFFFSKSFFLSIAFANPTSSWTQPQHFRRWWRSKGAERCLVFVVTWGFFYITDDFS